MALINRLIAIEYKISNFMYEISKKVEDIRIHTDYYNEKHSALEQQLGKKLLIISRFLNLALHKRKHVIVNSSGFQCLIFTI
jgi:antitoxin component HigA of HigAB toxin-antitoxin module